MPSVEEKLLDLYAYEKRLAECSYEMMGKMLDPEYMKKSIGLLDASEIYVYGGGYLGIQFYWAAVNHINIPAIADKKGKLAFPILQIPVINYEQLKERYNGQKIVVASIQYYNEIKSELVKFTSPNHIVYIGELFGGII